jgi:hypothetical protein
MPRAGHKLGRQGAPSEIAHYESRLGIRLTADKLTKAKRDLARSDPAVAEHLRRRIREPGRFNAMMAGRSRYASDTACRRCGGNTRTVYGAACWTCQTSLRPLQLTDRGRVAGWPPAFRSRAGWLALCGERRRERQGERETRTFGPFTATTTPTGTLSISAPVLGLSIPDLSLHSFDFINNIATRHPKLLDVLRWAGWTS